MIEKERRVGKELGALFGALLLAAAVYFLDLGGPALWDRDEPRNAQCAREMLERNDWVVPYFNGQLRDHKPVLLYWLMMVSYSLFGVNEFSARAPSALLAIGTVLLTYWMGKRIWDRTTAFWASVCLATMVLFALVARAATPDAALIFCSTASLALFVRGSGDFVPSTLAATWRTPFPESWHAGALIYVPMALGVLAKGPVGLVLPTAVIGMYCLMRRLPAAPAPQPTSWFTRLQSCVRPFMPGHFFKTCWAMRPLTAIGTTLLLACPWYAWVGVRTDGAWLSGFFGTHNLGRALGTMESHGGGPWFYPLVLLVGSFPWSVLTIPTFLAVVTGLRQNQLERSTPRAHCGWLLIICWLSVYVLAFTLSATKLPNYVAPCYPALAMLFGSVISDSLTSNRTVIPKFWWHVGMATQCTVGIAITVALWLFLKSELPALQGLCLLGSLPVFFGALGWVACVRGSFGLAVRTLAASATALTFGLVVIAAGRVSHLQQIDDAFQTHELAAGDYPLVSLGLVEPSAVFYAGQPILEIPVEELASIEAVLQANPKALILGDRPVTASADAFSLRSIRRIPRFLREGHIYIYQVTDLEVATGEPTNATR